MLKGRLGLETARVPHVDRHGLLWLGRGRLFVEAGTLRFVSAGTDALPAGTYDIPYQMVSMILLAPGTTVTHDVLRLMSRHGTGLLAVGEDGVRFYAQMPFGPDDSALARKHARLWGNPDHRIFVARKMYAMRMGRLLPHADIEVLRGIEGARARKMYEHTARQFGIEWKGRRYDRDDPESADLPNQAINHVSTIVVGAALIATAATGALPQLGFIHEDSGQSFALDIADLYRDKFTIPIAFAAVRDHLKRPRGVFERHVRQMTGLQMRKDELIPDMIDKIKDLVETPWPTAPDAP
jgi:CRISPR-associated protein Cas1